MNATATSSSSAFSTSANSGEKKAKSVAEEGALQIISKKLGTDVAEMVRSYINTPPNSAFKVTCNGASGDCWANAPENFMLKEEKVQLLNRLVELAKEGNLTREMFFMADPNPDLTGQQGGRGGPTLAFDLAMRKKYHADYTATDAVIEQSESFLRGEKGKAETDHTVAVFNGKGENGRNGAPMIKTLLSHSDAAHGIRCSMKWAIVDSVQYYHMATIEKIENGKVYLYQPNVVEPSRSQGNAPGPTLTYEGNGIQSMPIDEFQKCVRVAFVSSMVQKQYPNIKRVEDPAYAQAARGELPASEYIDNNNTKIVKPFFPPDLYQQPEDDYAKRISKIIEATKTLTPV